MGQILPILCRIVYKRAILRFTRKRQTDILLLHGWFSLPLCCAGLVSTQYGGCRGTILLVFSAFTTNHKIRWNQENLRRNHYAPIRRGSPCVTAETHLRRPHGAKRCAPSQAPFPLLPARP